MDSGFLPVFVVQNHRHVENPVAFVNLRHSGAFVSRLDGVEHFRRTEAVLQQTSGRRRTAISGRPGCVVRFTSTAPGIFSKTCRTSAGLLIQRVEVVAKNLMTNCAVVPDNVSSIRSARGDSMVNVAPGNRAERGANLRLQRTSGPRRRSVSNPRAIRCIAGRQCPRRFRRDRPPATPSDCGFFKSSAVTSLPRRMDSASEVPGASAM